MVLSAARDRSPEQSNEALQQLCGAYWQPLYAYVRRRVPTEQEAQDLTQAFFERMLERNYLAVADPSRGRFRAFLLTALKHFLSKEWDKLRTLKRGGGVAILSLDFASGESNYQIAVRTQPDSDALYDRQWAMTVLEAGLEELRQEWSQKNQAGQFEKLSVFLAPGNSDQSYAAVADQLQMSDSAVRMAVSRMRRRYGELIREVIAETLASEADVDDELNHLFACLSQK